MLAGGAHNGTLAKREPTSNATAIIECRARLRAATLLHQPQAGQAKPRHSGIRDGPTKRLVSSGSVLQSEHHFGLVHADVTGPTFAKRLPLSIRSWGRGGKERQREVEVEVEAGPSGSGLRARFYVLGAGADSLRCSVGWGLGVGCMELWTVNCRDSKVNKSTKIKNDTLAARHHHNQT